MREKGPGKAKDSSAGGGPAMVTLSRARRGWNDEALIEERTGLQARDEDRKDGKRSTYEVRSKVRSDESTGRRSVFVSLQRRTNRENGE